MTLQGTLYVRLQGYPNGEALWEATEDAGMPSIRQYPSGEWRVGPFTDPSAEEVLKAWGKTWFVLGAPYRCSCYWRPGRYQLVAQEPLYPDLQSRDSGWTASDGIWDTSAEDAFDTPEEALADWACYRLQGMLLDAARLLLEASRAGLLPASLRLTNGLAAVGLGSLEAYRRLKGQSCRGR